MDRSRFRGPSPENNISCSSVLSIDVKELKKIKVAIRRNITTAENEAQHIDRTLEKPEDLTIHRCHGEGSRPIFDREGIIVNKETAVSERRTISNRSPRRSPRSNRNSDHRRSEYSRRETDTSRSNDHSRSSHGRESPRVARTQLRTGSPRRSYTSSSRHDSRNRDNSRRSRYNARSASRSPRREQLRRRISRSPEDRDRRRQDHRDYDHRQPERRHSHSRRSRSPRYSLSRRRSRSRPPNLPHTIDPNAFGTIPVILPPELHFYGPEEHMWFPAPLRPHMFPRGMMPPRGIYRTPMYRPPMTRPAMYHPPMTRPPYIPVQRHQMIPIRAPPIRPRVPR